MYKDTKIIYTAQMGRRMSSGFERRKEQSKEEIRRAAWELFAQFGVERVSIADIARKAGVSQATIYNNFANKEALIREFVAVAVEGLVSGIEQVLAPEMPFQEKLIAFANYIGETIASGGPVDARTAVFSGSADLLNDPEIRKIKDAARERMTGLMLRLVAEGKVQGEVNPTLSDEALSVYFRAFMDIFIDPQLQRRFARSAALTQELGSLMIYGLTGPGVMPSEAERVPE
jgi:AcrR family transcriptional regulator